MVRIFVSQVLTNLVMIEVPTTGRYRTDERSRENWKAGVVIVWTGFSWNNIISYVYRYAILQRPIHVVPDVGHTSYEQHLKLFDYSKLCNDAQPHNWLQRPRPLAKGEMRRE